MAGPAPPPGPPPPPSSAPAAARRVGSAAREQTADDRPPRSLPAEGGGRGRFPLGGALPPAEGRGPVGAPRAPCGAAAISRGPPRACCGFRAAPAGWAQRAAVERRWGKALVPIRVQNSLSVVLRFVTEPFCQAAGISKYGA